MKLFSKKTLTWPQNFAAAFSGFQRKNKILWRLDDANSIQNFISLFRMGLISLERVPPKTTTHIFRTPYWSHGFSIRPSYQSPACNPSPKNMDNLFQSDPEGPFFMDETGTPMALFTFLSTGNKRTDNSDRRFYNATLISKSTIGILASRSCQPTEQTSFPLGTVTSQFGSDRKLQQQTYSLSFADAPYSKRRQSHKIALSVAVNAGSPKMGARGNSHQTSPRLMVHERSFYPAHSPSNELHHRTSQKRFGALYCTFQTGKKKARASTHLRRPDLSQNHPKRKIASGNQAACLWQKKIVSILQLQSKSEVPKGVSMQNGLVSIPAGFRKMDQMALIDLHIVTSSRNRGHPGLCPSMVDRTDVQRAKKSLRSAGGMATNSSSIGQMDGYTLTGIRLTKASCFDIGPSERCRSFSYTLEKKQTDDRRMDGYSNRTIFSRFIGSPTLGSEMAKNAGAKGPYNSGFQLKNLKTIVNPLFQHSSLADCMSRHGDVCPN